MNRNLAKKNLICGFICCFLMLAPAGSAMATDYYVRPRGGDYGLENGSSYENAWDGLESVVFGAGGVGPGDTLWVCGTHIHKKANTNWFATIADVKLVSGTDEDHRVTVRGDHPGDPGTVSSAYYPNFLTWTEVQPGVYSSTVAGNHYPDWFFWDNNGALAVLEPVATLDELKATPGTIYSPDYKSNSPVYAHLPDGGNPTGLILFNRFGYQLWIGSNSWITIKNIDLIAHQPMWQELGNDTPTHIRFEGCRFIYGEARMITAYPGTHYLEVINCEIGWATNGIYNICIEVPDCPSNYRYIGNYIHDIGTRTDPAVKQDAHSIGIQGGDNGWIEGNFMENVGSGPVYYAYKTTQMRNNVVIRNYVRNTHQRSNASGFGYGTSCNNDAYEDKSGNYWLFNIAENCPTGFRLNFEDMAYVYYNITYNCNDGFASSRSYLEIGPQVKYRRNIMYGSSVAHIYFASSGASAIMDADQNVYYPDGDVIFALAHNKRNMTGWRAFDIRNYKFDPSSVIQDVDLRPQGADGELFPVNRSGPPYFDAAALQTFIMDTVDSQFPGVAKDFDIPEEYMTAYAGGTASMPVTSTTNTQTTETPTTETPTTDTQATETPAAETTSTDTQTTETPATVTTSTDNQTTETPTAETTSTDTQTTETPAAETATTDAETTAPATDASTETQTDAEASIPTMLEYFGLTAEQYDSMSKKQQNLLKQIYKKEVILAQ